MLTVIRNTPLEYVTVTLTIRAPFSPFEVECCQPLSPVLLTPIFYHILPKFTTFFDNAGNTDNAGVTDNASNADNSGVTDYTFKIKLSIKKIFRCSRMDGIAENLSLNHLFPIYS